MKGNFYAISRPPNMIKGHLETRSHHSCLFEMELNFHGLESIGGIHEIISRITIDNRSIMVGSRVKPKGTQNFHHLGLVRIS